MVGVELLAEAKAAGLDVLVSDDGRLIVRGPQSAEALARRLLAHKADVLTALLGANPPKKLPKAVCIAPISCRCGSTATRDVAIHGGRSMRRDCANCGRFLSFPVWYRTN